MLLCRKARGNSSDLLIRQDLYLHNIKNYVENNSCWAVRNIEATIWKFYILLVNSIRFVIFLRLGVLFGSLYFFKAKNWTHFTLLMMKA
jgi:hypothetical protein